MRTHDARIRSIEARRVERLGRLRGGRIECLAGIVWLTLDGDRRDIILQPGESFVVDVDALVLACALDGAPAVIDLVAAQPRRRHGTSAASFRLSAWSIAAVCAGFASFGLVELWRALVDMSRVLQRQG
jgi:hypothetical protein